MEGRIDKLLIDGNRTIAIELLSRDVSLEVIEKHLLPKYRNVGWRINRVDDQRDGDYYSFAKK